MVRTSQIFVRLLNDGVDVGGPVEAEQLAGNVYPEPMRARFYCRRLNRQIALVLLLVSSACAHRGPKGESRCTSDPNSFRAIVRAVLTDFPWNSVVPRGDSLELSSSVRVAPHLIPMPVESMRVAMKIDRAALAEWHVAAPILLAPVHDELRGSLAVAIVDEHGRVTGSCFAIVSLATPMMPKHQGSPFDRYFQVELQFTHGHYDIARVIELEI